MSLFMNQLRTNTIDVYYYKMSRVVYIFEVVVFLFTFSDALLKQHNHFYSTSLRRCYSIDDQCTRTKLFSSILESDQHISRADQEATYLLPNQSHLVEDLSKPYAQTLVSRGVVRVNNGLSQETAKDLCLFIDETLESSIEEVNTYKVPRAFRFANVLEKGNRWDLLLPFDDDPVHESTACCENSKIMLQAMNELLGENGKLGQILENVLGEDAVLYELGKCLQLLLTSEARRLIFICFLSMFDQRSWFKSTGNSPRYCLSTQSYPIDCLFYFTPGHRLYYGTNNIYSGYSYSIPSQMHKWG